jgi:hypothetical protein
MPLFGGKDPAEDEAAQALVHWVNSAPGDLAAELMAAFGPGGARRSRPDVLTPGELADWLFRLYRSSYFQELYSPMREALQLLEHAELVYVRWRYEPTSSDKGNLGWSVTRLGLTTLADGKAAVRQRIKDRTGL